MNEEFNEEINSNSLVPVENTIDKVSLNKESTEIVNQIIAETDVSKTKDLTDLFNINQKKKTMVRLNKIGELQDILIDQAIERFTKRPDELDNATMIQAMKATQDMAERSQKMINDADETPLIQINQQNNEVNLGDAGNLNKESRDKVKSAVAAILAGINTNKSTSNSEVKLTEIKEEETNND